MQCYIYKSLKIDELYLYLTRKDDYSSVPENLLKSFGKLEFVMELELSPARKLARESSLKVMEKLHENGFFVQLPPNILTNTQQTKNLH